MTDWREALAPTPDCVDLGRLGEELTAEERAHLDTCARCQSELALFREFQNDEPSAEGEWVAGELRRRFDNVKPFRAKTWRVLYAAAAALVLLIGAGWWLQLREPSIDGGALDPGPYRSARLDLIEPVGDLASPPNELRWSAVPNTSRYRVRILEVDATVVWSGETTETHVALPPAVVAQFSPGKSLRWEVQAFRGTEVLAASETQIVRVTP